MFHRQKRTSFVAKSQFITIYYYCRSGGRVDKPGRGRGGSRGGRGGRGGGRGRGKKEPAPSAEELDKELDTYLKAR